VTKFSVATHMREDTDSNKLHQAKPQNQYCGMAWEKHHVKVPIYRNVTGHNLLHQGNRQLCISPEFASSALRQTAHILPSCNAEGRKGLVEFSAHVAHAPQAKVMGNKMQKVLFEGEQGFHAEAWWRIAGPLIQVVVKSDT